MLPSPKRSTRPAPFRAGSRCPDEEDWVERQRCWIWERFLQPMHEESHARCPTKFPTARPRRPLPGVMSRRSRANPAACFRRSPDPFAQPTFRESIAAAHENVAIDPDFAANRRSRAASSRACRSRTQSRYGTIDLAISWTMSFTSVDATERVARRASLDSRGHAASLPSSIPSNGSTSWASGSPRSISTLRAPQCSMPCAHAGKATSRSRECLRRGRSAQGSGIAPGFYGILHEHHGWNAAGGLGRAKAGSCGARLWSGPMAEVFEATQDGAFTHFFYGGTPGVAEELKGKSRGPLSRRAHRRTYGPPFRPLNEAEAADLAADSGSSNPHHVGRDTCRSRSVSWPSICQSWM